MNKSNCKAALPFSLTVTLTIVLYAVFSSASGIIHNIDPVMLQFKIPGIEISFRYYGLVYLLGFLALYGTLALKRTRGELLPGPDQVEIFVFLGFLSIIVGARLFEVLFYDIHRYLQQPVNILKIWEGGLSFHGALAGMALTAWLYSRKKKIHSLDLTDALSLPAAFFLSLGRGANFINGELYGIITDLPWGVKFRGVDGFRHPTQIYEALKNLYLFSGLYWFSSKKPPRGTLTFLFLSGYGLLRFLLEFLKNYNQYGYRTLETPALNMAQLLCLLMCIAGISGLLMSHRKKYEEPLQNT